MDPGGGTSVQCSSLGMLLSAGTVVPLSFVVGDRLSWWEQGTKRTVLMGAMIRRDGLFAWGVGTAGFRQREAYGQSPSVKTHGCP
jgi:hypothetical protein